MATSATEGNLRVNKHDEKSLQELSSFAARLGSLISSSHCPHDSHCFESTPSTVDQYFALLI